MSLLVGTIVPEDEMIAFLSIRTEQGVEKGTTNLLSEIVLTEFQNLHPKVIGGSDLTSMLDVEATKGQMGCNDTSCLAEVGAALGARYIADATLGLIGTRFVFAIKIIDTKNVQVLKRISKTGKMDDEVLIETVVQAVRELMGSEKTAKSAETKPALSVVAETKPVKSGSSLMVPAFSVAGVALAGGLVMGLMASGADGDLADMGTPTASEVVDYNDTRDKAKRYALIADGLFGVAVVGAIIGG
ncbi:hypothetical protein KAI87_17420, partial [Myxococcota bacterium]|nr:hypothetical protein [Myxococcota bacterium]